MLVASGELRKRPATATAQLGEATSGTYVPRRPGGYPAAEVSLRSASPERYDIVDVSSGELLGSTEAARAHSTVHEGAVYLHLGRSYEVRELDLDRRRALVAPFDGDWYTQPKRATDTDIIRLLDRRQTLGVTLSFGHVSVTDTVLAYQRKGVADHAFRELHALDLPPVSFDTQALWFELPGAGSPLDAAAALAGSGADSGGSPPPLDWQIPLELLLGALHATEHAQIAVLPLIAMCDRWDIGGLSTNFHPQTGVPTIFVYDGHPGGIGIARTAFQRFEELCRDAHALIAECPCAERLPLVRAVAQVRQPQRAAFEGRRAGTARADARRRRRRRRARADQRTALRTQQLAVEGIGPCFASPPRRQSPPSSPASRSPRQPPPRRLRPAKRRSVKGPADARRWRAGRSRSTPATAGSRAGGSAAASAGAA